MSQNVPRRARKEFIRREWKERAGHLWDPQAHGTGLKPLILSAPAQGSADLEYWYTKVSIGDRTVDTLVCEGVLVAIVRDGRIAETILAQAFRKHQSMPEQHPIPPKLAEAFVLAIEEFKKWTSDRVDEPVVILPSGSGDPITVICRMVERFDDQMPEQVLRIVRPFWDEVNFGEELVDNSYANAARLLRNRAEMRRAVYRAQCEAKQSCAADPR